MNKNDLIQKAGGVIKTQYDAKRIINYLFMSMRDALMAHEKVVIHGFGSFHIITRKAKVGRNIHTGKTVPIPARFVIKFKKAKDFNLEKIEETTSKNTVEN
jgi:DNA-binding protein HU-beta